MTQRFKGQDVEVIRDARDGDYGWQADLGQVIVKFADGHEETARKVELDAEFDPEWDRRYDPRDKRYLNEDAWRKVHSGDHPERKQSTEGNDARDADVKRDEVDAERHARKGE